MTVKEMKSADVETLVDRMCRIYSIEYKWAAEEVGKIVRELDRRGIVNADALTEKLNRP